MGPMATMVQLASAAPMERAYSTLSSAGQRSMVALVRLAVQERVAAADLLAQALTSLQRRMAIDSSASTPCGGGGGGGSGGCGGGAGVGGQGGGGSFAILIAFGPQGAPNGLPRLLNNLIRRGVGGNGGPGGAGGIGGLGGEGADGGIAANAFCAEPGGRGGNGGDGGHGGGGGGGCGGISASIYIFGAGQNGDNDFAADNILIAFGSGGPRGARRWFDRQSRHAWARRFTHRCRPLGRTLTRPHPQSTFPEHL